MAKLILALDMESREENLRLCRNLASENIKDLYLKVGLRSFIRDGVSFIDELKSLGFKVFLDLKLYDIPNTMLDSIKEISMLNIDIITIHASSGRVAMVSIAKYLHSISKPPLIFAVSALTSFDNEGFREIYNIELDSSVIKFAKISSECGINGVVCSPLESEMIKEAFPNLLTLTPGIRPQKSDFQDSDFNKNIALESAKDDQNRISSIKDALAQKSDFIVIGRPIYKNKEPLLLTKYILEVLEG